MIFERSPLIVAIEAMNSLRLERVEGPMLNGSMGGALGKRWPGNLSRNKRRERVPLSTG